MACTLKFQSGEKLEIDDDAGDVASKVASGLMFATRTRQGQPVYVYGNQVEYVLAPR